MYKVIHMIQSLLTRRRSSSFTTVYPVCTEDHMKMLQNQMDSISLDVAQISAHAKAQVRSILEVNIHLHILGTLHTRYILVLICRFILFRVKCIQCAVWFQFSLYVSTLTL